MEAPTPTAVAAAAILVPTVAFVATSVVGAVVVYKLLSRRFNQFDKSVREAYFAALAQLHGAAHALPPDRLIHPGSFQARLLTGFVAETGRPDGWSERGSGAGRRRGTIALGAGEYGQAAQRARQVATSNANLIDGGASVARRARRGRRQPRDCDDDSRRVVDGGGAREAQRKGR
jgi:hypothetical protein